MWKNAKKKRCTKLIIILLIKLSPKIVVVKNSNKTLLLCVEVFCRFCQTFTFVELLFDFQIYLLLRINTNAKIPILTPIGRALILLPKTYRTFGYNVLYKNMPMQTASLINYALSLIDNSFGTTQKIYAFTKIS